MSRSFFLPDKVQSYVQAWGVRANPVLERCRRETQAGERSSMQISPEQGAFMQALVMALGAQRALEVGVFTGYSGMAVALAMQALHGEDCRLVGCDISQDYVDKARGYWREAGVDALIETRIGPAADSLKALLDEGRADSFDLMFIDADKTGYDAYYELGLQLLRPRGVMLIDNMLWSGAVADPDDHEADTEALRALARKIHGDERVDMTLATVGDGLSVVVKR
jgi:caffeoyl-CoA O-methyltransferase